MGDFARLHATGVLDRVMAVGLVYRNHLPVRPWSRTPDTDQNPPIRTDISYSGETSYWPGPVVCGTVQDKK